MKSSRSTSCRKLYKSIFLHIFQSFSEMIELIDMDIIKANNKKREKLG
jgi:hypothetical protein